MQINREEPDWKFDNYFERPARPDEQIQQSLLA